VIIGIDIGQPTVQKLRICSEALVVLNIAFLKKTKKSVPPLYRSGVRYRREGPPAAGQPRLERFQTIPEVLKRKYGDCEDLAAWRVAELRMSGIRAVPWIVQPGKRLYHVQVKYPDGRIEDPSKKLGMKGRG
jgi:hypothetical protein